MVANIVGYHANYASKFPDPIPENYLIVSNDTDWLGNGMYYWDNRSNAQYWIRKKKKDSPGECIFLVAGNIIIDQLLDLTDQDIIGVVEKTWINYCKLKKIVDYSNIPIGVRLNRLFDFFAYYRQEYKVIKGIGFYRRAKQHVFFIDENCNKEFPCLTSQIKTIYCVKCCDKISNLMKIEED